jgi:hypothetical protein
MTPKKQLESYIVKEICEWLAGRKDLTFWRSNNVPVFSFSGRNNKGEMRYRSLPKYTPRGLPDIMVICNGKFIGIEVKREGAKLRPEQAEMGMRITLNGGFYFVAHSLHELKELFIPLY